MRTVRTLFVAAALSTAAIAGAADPAPAPAAGKRGAAETAQPEAKCQHGVKAAICARCNPKLAPVFKAKGDWCPEHARPESQCVLCNPVLAKDGIK